LIIKKYISLALELNSFIFPYSKLSSKALPEVIVMSEQLLETETVIAIEILMQVMENQRDDIVVILAGYKTQMEHFFHSNPGMNSRIGLHIEFNDYTVDNLMIIAQSIVKAQNYCFSPDAEKAFREYLIKRKTMAHFANARSVRNAIDRARLRQANRLLSSGKKLNKQDLITIEAVDILASRVFREGVPDCETES
jgi:hypothetical protein